MEARNILTLGIYIFSIPFIAFSRIAESINLWNLKADITHCLQVIDSNSIPYIPVKFIKTLVIAEDHRNSLHFGIDPIGIIRAITLRVRQKLTQGASTVEQQFVRVVTGDYEMSIKRKLREQALAIALSRRCSKAQIASAYLSIAYYGDGKIGASGLKALCGHDLLGCPKQKVYETIARLKYPEPLQPSETWRIKLYTRTNHIMRKTLEQENKFRRKFWIPKNRSYNFSSLDQM